MIASSFIPHPSSFVSGLLELRSLTEAAHLLRAAQERDETSAWITTHESVFYPPDFAANGIDLDALVVIRLEKPNELSRATNHLARSAAFGFIVLDLGKTTLPIPVQARFAQIALRHSLTIVCLTHIHTIVMRNKRFSLPAFLAHDPPLLC